MLRVVSLITPRFIEVEIQQLRNHLIVALYIYDRREMMHAPRPMVYSALFFIVENVIQCDVASKLGF